MILRRRLEFSERCNNHLEQRIALVKMQVETLEDICEILGSENRH